MSMSFDRAVEIADGIAKAVKKYGKHGDTGVHRHDICEALTIFYDRVVADGDAGEQLRSAEITIENLEAEVLRLKQVISGKDTAYKKLRSKQESTE